MRVACASWLCRLIKAFLRAIFSFREMGSSETAAGLASVCGKVEAYCALAKEKMQRVNKATQIVFIMDKFCCLQLYLLTHFKKGYLRFEQ